MRTKLPVLLALILFLIVSTSNASAVDTASSAPKLRDQIGTIREQKQKAVAKIKDDARLAIKARQDEFRTKLQAIKDLKKKAILENVNAKLTEVNRKNTDKFSDVLTKLQTFLDKVESAATAPKIISNIANAQIAIDTAQAAVATQAANDYTIQVTGETVLKANANSAISQLKKDLSATHKLVIDAKQAVQLLRTDKIMIKKEATSSANL